MTMIIVLIISQAMIRITMQVAPAMLGKNFSSSHKMEINENSLS